MANIAALVGSFAGLLTAITVLIATLKNGQKIGATHDLVNSRMTDALRRINQLANTIAQAGIVIPDDPSIPDPKDKP